MARFIYECNTQLRNNSDGNLAPRQCSSDKYCIFCNAQCCLTLQRKALRYFYETWYFWLGIGLLVVFIVSTVSSYVISHCKHNILSVIYRPRTIENSPNASPNNSNSSPRNEIAINIIPPIPSHRKMLLVSPQSSCGYMNSVPSYIPVL
ncbi:uncharacterized protein LOC117175491 [Belonocnema kinseyi]|uniref:uncharacterized protein LOC117175491 n=1 Tax=Belonocnema kinseyi TaxID=2817044 RepID=UPI00143DC968|nr:uncharacterized protein LOC117175491 [Belonocnema kinseyi]